MEKAIEIISREHHTQQTVSLGSSANSSLDLAESSVVQMQASPADILSYERVGDDLVVHMKDGSTIDYSDFFLKDAAGKHSELVLSEAGKQPVHVAFDEAAMADASAQGGAAELSASMEPLESTDSLLSSNAAAGAAGGLSLASLVGIGVATAAIGGAGIAAHNNSKDDDDHDRDADAPGIVVNPITGDDIITAEEAAKGVTVDGSTTPGAEVVVVVDGKEFPTTAGDNGEWAVDIPAEALNGAGGDDGITVVVTEPDGDTASIDYPVIIGTDEVPITVNPITGDDIITAEEAANGVTVDGTTTPGAEVVVVVDGKEFPTTAGDNGEWAVEVPAEALDGAGGDDGITVVVTEPDGDTSAIDYPVIIGTDDLKITVNPITGDDVVSAREAAEGITIDGTSSAPGAGCEVMVRVGEMEFTTTTDENGNWSVDIPAEAWNDLDGNTNIVVVMTNETGATDAVDHTVTVSIGDIPVVINPIAGDDVITAEEAANGVTIDGTTTPGAEVVVVAGGKEFSVTADDNGDWAVKIPPEALEAASDEDLIKVKVTEPDGDTKEINHPVIISTDNVPITINPITGDDIITAEEAAKGVTIDGTTTPSAEVVVVVDGKEFPTTAGDNGEWAVEIPAEALDAAGGDDGITVVVTEPDGDTAAIDYPVVIGTDEVPITVNPITGDDIITAEEAAKGVTIDGSTTPGAEVIVLVGGKKFPTTAGDNGEWAVEIPAEALDAAGGNDGITVVVTEPDGDTSAIDYPVIIGTDEVPITVNPITGDDIITAEEAAKGVTIDGSTTPGAEVVVVVDGKEFPTTAGDNGEWAVEIPAEALNGAGGNDGITVVVTEPDGDTSAIDYPVIIGTDEVPITVNPITGDDIITAEEAAKGVTVDGTTTPGAEVVVVVDGKEFPTTAGDNGEWAVEIPAEALNGAGGDDGITVVVTEPDGDTSAIDYPVIIGTDDIPVTVNPITGDNRVNAAEAKNAVIVDGTTMGGCDVKVRIGDMEFVTTADKNGHWEVEVPSKSWNDLNGEVEVVVVVSNEAGDTAAVEHAVTLDTTAPMLTIDAVGKDGIINAAEVRLGTTINGTADAGSMLVVKVGNEELKTTADENGHWSVPVSTDILGALDGKVDVSVTAHDEAGNNTELAQSIIVDTAPPTLEVDLIGGDDIIDASEHGQDLTITGTTDDSEKIKLTLNGKDYFAVIAEDGTWSVHVPGEDVGALSTGKYSIIASATDLAGNVANKEFSFQVNAEDNVRDNIERFETVDPELSVTEGETVTLESGLVLTGVKNAGATENLGPMIFSVHDNYYDIIRKQTLIVGGHEQEKGEGAIGEISFGGPVDSVSFDYRNAGVGCYVEVYDSNGNMIYREELEGSKGDQRTEPFEFKYQATNGVYIDHIRLDVTNDYHGIGVDNIRWTSVDDGVAVQSHGLEGVQASSPSESENPVAGSADDDHLTSTADNDHFSIGNGGGDLLTYHLLNAADATGGNGVDRISGFTVGNGADADRIDLRELLADTGYRGSVEGQPDEEALAEFIKVTVKGNDTEVAIDRDGAGNSHEMTTLVTLSDVQTDLATLLANQQLIV